MYAIQLYNYISEYVYLSYLLKSVYCQISAASDPPSALYSSLGTEEIGSFLTEYRSDFYVDAATLVSVRYPILRSGLAL